jgi:hypothetical protein
LEPVVRTFGNACMLALFAYTGGPSSSTVLPREDRGDEELLDRELIRTKEPLDWGRKCLTEGFTATGGTVTECHVKVTVHSFNGILRDGRLCMVFSGYRDLSMLSNQFFFVKNVPF